MNRRTLGRGLQALLGMEENQDSTLPLDADGDASPAGMVHVPLDQIDVNPYQPRRDFEERELRELAESVRLHGVIQPVVVRGVEGRFQLVAGERRFRAAKLAGIDRIPARVLELDDRQTFEIALIENLQRRDLNAIEKAEAFRGYLDKFGVTHEKLAEHLGVDRSTVTNLVRLLDLSPAAREAARSGAISFGHARALLAVPHARQSELCRRIVGEGLSVRQTEALVKELSAGAPDSDDAVAVEKTTTRPAAPEKSNHVLSIENEIRRKLGMKVEIQLKAKDQGTVVFSFASSDDFERLVEALLGKRST